MDSTILALNQSNLFFVLYLFTSLLFKPKASMAE